MQLRAHSSENLCQVTVLKICDLAHVYVIYIGRYLQVIHKRFPLVILDSTCIHSIKHPSTESRNFHFPKRLKTVQWYSVKSKISLSSVPLKYRRDNSERQWKENICITKSFCPFVDSHPCSKPNSSRPLKWFHQVWKFKGAFVTSTFKVTKEKQNFTRWILSQETLRFFF